MEQNALQILEMNLDKNPRYAFAKTPEEKVDVLQALAERAKTDAEWEAYCSMILGIKKKNRLRN